MKESEQSTDSPEKSEKYENPTEMVDMIVMPDENDESSETSPYLTAELQGGGGWWITSGPDGQAGATLEGTIHNNRTENMVAIVHIWVFDGNNWRTFTENAGTVPAGGKIGFYWSQGLGKVDDNAVVVRYTVSRG